MRKIVVSLSVSLDGFVEGPDREIDWHLVDEELHTHFNEELRAMSAFLDGRVTHELMAGFWPTADADPAGSPAVREFAGIWRDMPKFVFSRTLASADWNSTVVREVVPAEIAALKAQPGGDMALGGAELVRTFRALDLVDSYRLYVNPVLLGRGHRLFADADSRTPLRPAGTRTFGNGVVLLRYDRDRTPQEAPSPR
jgi:dihydrofolate reductase